MARRSYPFHWIEPKWQAYWAQEQTFRAFNPGERLSSTHPFALRHLAESPSPTGISASATKVNYVVADALPPKYYILDMFPYPSGAGLHVGHPEGYTATDILARFKRAQGFHVLHPMGWDAFGLPAEQYAVRTGQHPRITTEVNIANFTRQIRALGFSYDWSRELATTDPKYLRWTQWIFLQLYNAWYNPDTRRAEPINTLPFPPEANTPAQRRAHQDAHRLAFVTDAPVWWCEALGTVLANEEVVDGRSEVGRHPVVRKPMRQWMLRITALADRLLEDLEKIDWTDSLKEMQRNWIGRSEGAEIQFAIHPNSLPEGATSNISDAECTRITVFTTRPDTLFGATYMVLAPEHQLVDGLIPAAWPENTPANWKGSEASAQATPADAIAAYRQTISRKSDLERTELSKEKTGVFTGAYAAHPITGQPVPIWIADYVLASYGTGAIMAVPAHDTRDFEFAQKFDLPILQVVAPPDPSTDWRGFVGTGVNVNSSHPNLSLDGLSTPEATARMIDWLESSSKGRRRVQFKLRDWLFSRQRYWGEPFPIVWRRDADGILQHEALSEADLPVLPPPLEDYKPTPDGQPPLARAVDWVKRPDGTERETNTMPQWAGSCWYYLRYLDPQNENAFVDPAAERYWMAGPTPGVDLYVGGTEHAVLHLLYARFWHKVLFDLGHVSTPEPFQRLVNQGLILGEDGQKMSKSVGNVVNPDDILGEYGADAFRLYEMFLGPLQDTKPWNTKGVEGVYRFLGRVWRLFIDETDDIGMQQEATVTPTEEQVRLLSMAKLARDITAAEPTAEQLRTLHACIRKVTEDLEGLRFNTAISALMVFINAALTWETKPISVLRTFLQLLAPLAPHLAEELWQKLHMQSGNEGAETGGEASDVLSSSRCVPSLSYEPWPKWDPRHLVESTREIPVQINGKLRERISIASDASREQQEQSALNAPKIQVLLAGQEIDRIVVVPGKLVNIVLRKSKD